MENNIFLKNTKFNPDVLNKLNSEKTIRNNISYTTSNVIYNPITGIVPDKINSVNDLKLTKDIQINTNDFKKLILEKEKERTEMFNNNSNNNTKPNNDYNNYNNSNTKPNINRTNYIQTFEELKNPQKNNINNGNKNNNVINELKHLGIFN
jgi:hypothetical protein